MIPRRYIFEDADSMSPFLDHSKFNGFLLDGLLEYMNSNPNRTLTLDPLGFFNEVYYFANRIMFEPFPEIDIRNRYIGECMDHTHDVLTRDIVFAMLFVVLDRLRDMPGKAVRFCNQLEVIYNYREGYLGTFYSLSSDCERAGLYSDWNWTPPAVDAYILFGDVEDWREATDGFKYDFIKAYYDSCNGVQDQYYVMDDIFKQLKEYRDSHPDEISKNQFDKVLFLHITAKRNKEREDEAEAERKRQEEETAKAAAEPEVPALSEKESELQSQLAERDAEIDRLNKDIEHKNAYIREHNGKESELASKLRISEDLVAELREQLQAFSEEDSADEVGVRTQKVVTNYLFSILKKAGLGNETVDYNKTDVADLIHYLTGFSTNTIRTTLTYPRTSSSSSKEVKKVEALLKKVNLDISIK